MMLYVAYQMPFRFQSIYHIRSFVLIHVKKLFDDASERFGVNGPSINRHWTLTAPHEFVTNERKKERKLIINNKREQSDFEYYCQCHKLIPRRISSSSSTTINSEQQQQQQQQRTKTRRLCHWFRHSLLSLSLLFPLKCTLFSLPLHCYTDGEEEIKRESHVRFFLLRHDMRKMPR